MTRISEEVHTYTRTVLQSQNLSNSETCRQFLERFLYYLNIARHYISQQINRNIHQQHNEKNDVGCRLV